MRLKDASDAKSTVDGRSFHTLTSLSAKNNLLRGVQLDRGLYIQFVCMTSGLLYKTKLKLEMWDDAQRDGRPAEHRWRPLFNAAKFG